MHTKHSAGQVPEHKFLLAEPRARDPEPYLLRSPGGNVTAKKSAQLLVLKLGVEGDSRVLRGTGFQLKGGPLPLPLGLDAWADFGKQGHTQPL